MKPRIFLTTILQLAFVMCYGQAGFKAAKTMPDAAFNLERYSGSVEKKFGNAPLPEITELISKIKAEKEAILRATTNVDDPDFIASIDGDSEALMLMLHDTSKTKVLEKLRDVEEDLRIKSTSRDTSLGLSDQMFQKIPFKVKPCRIVNGVCVTIDPSLVKANCWALRGKPEPLYDFNNQLAHDGLPVELVRGIYGFWVEMPNHPLDPPARVYIKIVVDERINNQLVNLSTP